MEPSSNPCTLQQDPHSAFLLLVPTGIVDCGLVIDIVLPKSGSEENHLPTHISRNVLCNFPLEISCSFHSCFQRTRITISSQLIYRKSNVQRETDVQEWEIFVFLFTSSFVAAFFDFSTFLPLFFYFVQLVRDIWPHTGAHTHAHIHTQRGTTTYGRFFGNHLPVFKKLVK